ncbi:MAG: NTF2-like N-terminal transpeptidase domain-containing protein [Chloroflexota bacterium]
MDAGVAGFSLYGVKRPFVPGRLAATPSIVTDPCPYACARFHLHATPPADGTGAVFLSTWSTGNYDATYDLLTDTARASLSRDHYLNALNEATVTTVQTELLSLLHDGPQAQAGFRARWQINRFGALDFDNTMTLLWAGERWGVDWSSKLVLPQLGDDLNLVLLDQNPERGHIYNQNGLGLAVAGQRVIIGVVPGWLQDEATAVAQGSVNNNDILLSLVGVSRQEHTVRNYKEGDLAAHLVGYLGAIPPDEQVDWQLQGYWGDEGVGQAGVEARGEPYLAGKRGRRLVSLYALAVVVEHAGEGSKAAAPLFRQMAEAYFARQPE